MPCAKRVVAKHRISLTFHIIYIYQWRRAGFDTKVLTMEDAKKHSLYKEMKEVVDPLWGESYNGLCFYRWIAMAEVGGGVYPSCNIVDRFINHIMMNVTTIQFIKKECLMFDIFSFSTGWMSGKIEKNKQQGYVIFILQNVPFY